MSRTIPFYVEEFPRHLSELLREAMDSDRIAGGLERLEERIEAELGGPRVLGTSSSTAALHLAMCALDLKRGDKVVCPVNAFVDVPEVVRHFDAEPIFVDCDPRTYALDLEALDRVLAEKKTKKLRAVIASHAAGLPLDMQRLLEIAERHQVEVVDDASEALGARHEGRMIGSFPSRMTVFGFGSKLDNRFDAGALVTGDEARYERASLLRNHALHFHSETVEYLYEVEDIGCQYRMNDYDALCAEAIYDELEERIAQRRRVAEYYFKHLSGLKHLSLPVRSDEHLYTHFIVEIDKNRDAFARELKKAGISTGLHYVPLHLTRYYKEKYGLKVFDFPNALGVYQRILSLPNHRRLEEADLEYICEQIRRIDAAHV